MTIGSLFSGIGGLELALESCGLGPVIWQADTDPAARAVLARHWPDVRRYTDVREIDAEAERPDIICGGFPCTDISLAGKGAGIDGPASGLWSEFARIIGVLRPSIVYVENVAALAVRGLDRVLGDLASLGFDAEWTTVRASDVGAPHRRERLFVLAYSDSERVRQFAERDQRGGRGAREAERGDPEPLHHREALANADGIGPQARTTRRGVPGRRTDAQQGRGKVLADAHGGRREGERLSQPGRLHGSPGSVADGRGDERYIHRFPPGPSGLAGWDGPQPAIRRGDDGVPGRSHRLRLLGNAVVPQQAALAWRTLTARVLA